MTDIQYDIMFIESLLDEAVEFDLVPEVVFYALTAMKENPSLSETDAIVIGYNEWIK